MSALSEKSLRIVNAVRLLASLKFPEVSQFIEELTADDPKVPLLIRDAQNSLLRDAVEKCSLMIRGYIPADGSSLTLPANLTDPDATECNFSSSRPDASNQESV